MIIAIDGPAGAGKSTVAKIIAKRLGFLYIDTGAMYRALTLKTLEQKIDTSDITRIIETARNIRIDLQNEKDGSLKIFLDGIDVSKEIRQPVITKFVSDIAKIRAVREVMLGLQRKVGEKRDVVLDGRDIGTVVFPEAKHKFYVDADFNERVERRYKELTSLDEDISLEAVKKDLSNRDTIDTNREVAPLRRADDAVYIDTTDMAIEEVVEKILKEIHHNNG
jgi:cytidylate kinase